MIRGRAEGEEGDEAVVSGWIAVHVEAAAARRKTDRRGHSESMSKVDWRAGKTSSKSSGAQNALYVNARG